MWECLAAWIPLLGLGKNLREGEVGTIASIIASVLLGGVIATATVVGVINSQTGASGESPANVSQPVIDYGSTN